MRVQRNAERAVLCCSFCGRELALGETYWYISGWCLCQDCLPDFARAEYRGFECLRGREGAE